MDTTNTGDQISWQLILNFAAVYILRFFETSQWQIFANIREDAIWLKRAIILVFSTVTAAGLVLHFEIRTGNFVLSGNIWSLVHALQHVAQNYAGITGMYWGKYIFDSLNELVPILKRAAIVRETTVNKSP